MWPAAHLQAEENTENAVIQKIQKTQELKKTGHTESKEVQKILKFHDKRNKLKFMCTENAKMQKIKNIRQ